MSSKDKHPIRIQIRFVSIKDLRKKDQAKEGVISEASKRLVQTAKQDLANRRDNITWEIKKDVYGPWQPPMVSRVQNVNRRYRW